MNSIRFNAQSVPFAFAVITVLAYGLLLPLTGFYWDDWTFAWIARFLGPAEFIPAFQGFRPFLGPIFFLTTSLLHPDPLLWQVLALLVRFVAAVAAWFALHWVWPTRPRETLSAALLFLVFPGYSQHWVAFTHINQEWISFIACLLSFGLSAWATRKPGHVIAATTCSLLLLVIAIFPTEYFIGLEPLRFLLLWLIVAETAEGSGARLIRTLKIWLPYLVVWLLNAIWLVYYYRSGAYLSYDFTAGVSTPTFVGGLQVFGDAVWKAGLYVWIQILLLISGAPGAPTSLATLVLIVFAFVLVSAYLLRLDLAAGEGPRVPTRTGTAATRHADAGPARFAPSAFLIGLTGVLLGRVPSFAAGLPLTLQSSFDRFMISMMLGASLLVSGLIVLAVRNVRARTYILAGLLALSIGQQFFNANTFRRDWERQQEIYWQLAWRIPALQPHTVILTQQMPLDYETDLAMTAALNWIYAPKVQPPDLPYALLYTEKRLGGAALPDLQSGTRLQLPFRTLAFTGRTSQAIVIYVPPNGCLRVFDPALDDAQTYSSFPDSLIAPIPLSDPSLILTEGEPRALPVPPFSHEPTHAWCYFYERAELARQMREWKTIVQMHAEIVQEGLAPRDSFEWLPFIEAEARAGSLAWAVQTTHEALDAEPRLDRGLCVLWRRLESEGSLETRSAGSTLLAELRCGP